MLGLSRREIAGLVDAGFVSPERGPRQEMRFTFQDVVLLRTAWGLLRAEIPLARVLRSLKKLRATLPEALPLTGLRITAVGGDVAVSEGRRRWAADTGQMLLAFDVAADAGEVTFIDPPAAAVLSPVAGIVAAVPGAAAKAATPVRPATPARADAAAIFARGETAETRDPSRAEVLYRAALAADPAHVAAALNLVALLCEAGRAAEAIGVSDRALRCSPDEPLLHFNRAVALEDAGRPREALTAYERSLHLAPDMADAHYNAARLYDATGDKQKALRHYSSYRRLERS